MKLVMSPYHLTTREPACMAAVLLAEQIVTMLPFYEHDRSRSSLTTAALASEVVRSWQWSEDLWRAGVIVPYAEMSSPIDQIDTVSATLSATGGWAEMGIPDPEADGPPSARLEGLARDLLKSGPDPAWCVPVAAALDRFATEHGMMGVRGEPRSLAERIESKWVGQSFRIIIPGYRQASAERVLAIRDLIEDEAAALQSSIAGSAARADIREIRTSAGAFADAFERADASLLTDANELVPMVTNYSIEFGRLPVDAAVRSSLLAAKRVRGGGVATTFPRSDETFQTMIVRELGR